jgi:DNA-binding NarL/FixJ family response regulator
MRVVLVEDQNLLLEALAAAIGGRGVEVVGRARSDAEALVVLC